MSQSILSASEVSSKEFMEKFSDWLVLRYIKDKKKILDLGCGEGYIWKYLKSKGYDASGVDYPEVDAEEKLPFESNSFDVVICKSLFEHIANITGLTSEISRILKSGGLLIMTTNNTLKSYKSFLSDPTHKTPFSINRIKKLVSMFDFHTQELRKFRNLPYFWRYYPSAFDITFPGSNEIFGVFKK